MSIDIEKLIEEIERRKLPLNTLTKVFGNANLAALIRRKVLERRLGISLSSVGSTILDFEELEGRIIDNAIGGIQIPIAVVGPIRIEGSFLRGDVYLPIAAISKSPIQALEIGSRISGTTGGIEVQCLRKEIELRIALPRSACIDRVLDKLHRVEHDSIKAIHLELAEHETTIIFELREFIDEFELLNYLSSLPKDKSCEVMPIDVRYVGVSSLAKITLVDRALETISVDLSKLARTLATLVHRHEEVLSFLARTLGGVVIALGQPFENITRLTSSRLTVESQDNGLLLEFSLENLVLSTRSGGALLPMQREVLELAKIHEPNSVQKLAELLAAVGILGLLGYACLRNGVGI